MATENGIEHQQMKHDELASALETVHRELSETDQLDPTEVEQLRATMNEIQQVLDANDQANSLSERVRESADRFENTHPKLTQTLSNIVDILQRMGF